MKGTKRMIAAMITGFAVGKTVDSVMSGVEDAGPLFAVGRVIADVSFALVGMGCALRAFDAVEEAGKMCVEKLAKYGREANEEVDLDETVEDLEEDKDDE